MTQQVTQPVSTTTTFGPLTLCAATERVFDLRRLYDAGAVERTAALLRLSLIHDSADHVGLRRLCVRVAEGMQHPRAPQSAPVVDVVAQ